jgi:site-specific recombinase XerD
MKNGTKNLAQLITDFIEYCEIDRRLSPATGIKYDYRLSQFLGWMQAYTKQKNVNLADVDLESIRKFRLYLSRKEMRDSTIYNYMVTLRSFLKFLVKHDYKALEPVKIELAKYNPSRSLKFLKPEQFDELINSPNTSQTIGMRDRAILELLFSTGLRVSELASLNRDQVDLKSGEFSVIGKGRRRRVVFLSEEAIEWIKKYLNKRNDEFKPLFLHYSGPQSEVLIEEEKTGPQKGSRTHDNSEAVKKSDLGKHLEQMSEDPDGERYRLSVRSIQRMVKKYAKMAGVPVDVTPHVLRHTFATDLLSAGADLRTVQESLGHKNVATTQIYTHVTNLQLKRAHKEFHGQWRKK